MRRYILSISIRYKVTSVISENLSVDKVTIVDSGNGNGMPTYVKGVTGSIVAIIMEQIKNTTCLDIFDILQGKRGAITELQR